MSSFTDLEYGNDNFGGIRNELTEALADQGVGMGVHSGGGIVEDQG